MNEGAAWNLEPPERSQTITLTVPPADPAVVPPNVTAVIPDTTGEYFVLLKGDVGEPRPVAWWGGEEYRGRFVHIEGPAGATVFCTMRA